MIFSLPGEQRIKALQLACAKELGLTIPQTLISNSPDAIRSFLAQGGANRRFIAKPFRPFIWKGDSDDYVSHTAIVRGSDLPGDMLLQASPMIFQEYAPKEFEVRITCFGSKLIAAKLNSQAMSEATIDWRPFHPETLRSNH